jgi:hypothetical protein
VPSSSISGSPNWMSPPDGEVSVFLAPFFCQTTSRFQLLPSPWLASTPTMSPAELTSPTRESGPAAGNVAHAPSRWTTGRIPEIES